ncbi:MAG: hypothetical protein PGN08_07610 [Sphingomonas taxi]
MRRRSPTLLPVGRSAATRVARWLGGWERARGAVDEGAIVPEGPGDPDGHDPGLEDDLGGRTRSLDLPSETRLVWTETALTECHYLRQRLAHCGDDGERRVTSAIVAAMVTLIVEGGSLPAGPVDWPLSTTLCLRIHIGEPAIAVLGVRWHGRLV